MLVVRWLKLSLSLLYHPKAIELSRELGCPRSSWCVVALWLWAGANRPDGDLSGLPYPMLAGIAGWDGDPKRLIGSLQRTGFLDDDMRIHDWDVHQDGLMLIRDLRTLENAEKKRARDAERMREKRAAAKSGKLKRGEAKKEEEAHASSASAAHGPKGRRVSQSRATIARRRVSSSSYSEFSDQEKRTRDATAASAPGDGLATTEELAAALGLDRASLEAARRERKRRMDADRIRLKRAAAKEAARASQAATDGRDGAAVVTSPAAAPAPSHDVARRENGATPAKTNENAAPSRVASPESPARAAPPAAPTPSPAVRPAPAPTAPAAPLSSPAPSQSVARRENDATPAKTREKAPVSRPMSPESPDVAPGDATSPATRDGPGSRTNNATPSKTHEIEETDAPETRFGPRSPLPVPGQRMPASMGEFLELELLDGRTVGDAWATRYDVPRRKVLEVVASSLGYYSDRGPWPRSPRWIFWKTERQTDTEINRTAEASASKRVLDAPEPAHAAGHPQRFDNWRNYCGGEEADGRIPPSFALWLEMGCPLRAPVRELDEEDDAAARAAFAKLLGARSADNNQRPARAAE
jgi:hypothetical protein